REAVRLTQLAEREGADGVSVITPYFVHPTQQEVYDHYRRVAEHTSLPVVLYNNPGTCGGVKTDVDTVARLGEVPNLRADQRHTLNLCTAPGGVKAALEVLGMPIGPCRSPVAGLAPEKAPRMRAALEAAGLLPR